jgi:hypothetical protein
MGMIGSRLLQVYPSDSAGLLGQLLAMLDMINCCQYLQMDFCIGFSVPHSSLKGHGPILSFPVTDETFAWVRSPPFEVSSGVHLVELAGHLCMVRDLRNVSGVLEIWKLDDYGSGGWSLEHRIDLLRQHAGRDDLIEPQIIRVLGSVGNYGSSTKRIVIATSKRKVIVYDPMSQTLEETVIAIRETHSSYRAENLALTNISLLQESLVPVHQTNEERALSVPLARAAREILLQLPADCTM